MNQKHLRAILVIALALLASTVTLEAKDRKADKFFKTGQAAELKKDWDTAVTMYQNAVDASPTDLQYEIAMRRARFQSAQMHVQAGVKLRGEDKLPEAIQELQKALITDPSLTVALQELKRTQDMVVDHNRQGALAPGTAGLTATEKLRKEELDRVASIEGPAELKPTVHRLPSPMKMNNATVQTLFKTVAGMAGLYVDFDPKYQAPGGKPFDVNLDDMTVEQAFDYLAFVTHTFWKPISSNTVFVCEDNTTNRRDFEDEVVRVFYVPNAGTVQEFQEIANGIRTVTEIRRVFTYNAGRAMMVRGTADQVALVEKLVHDLDKPKSEVIVDIRIMQVNSTRSRQLAATIASAGTAGLNIPLAFTPRSSITVGGTTTTTTSSTTGTATTNPITTTPTTTTTGSSGSSSIALNSLAHIASSDFSTSLPGALLEAMLTDTRTKVLNSPQVRASDGAKAELQIGLRIPYATGSLGSAVGATTVGVSPLVQTQFSYADTGVTIQIQPTVHSSDELSMHVEITVASVQQYENLGGGISQPVISQEKNLTDVRMRNNEVSLLGGLNQSTDSSTVNGIPGLTNVPVLGKFLFGSQSTEKDSNQILIAMIPHIIRTPDYSPENLRSIFAGSDQNIKIVHASTDDGQAAPAATPPAVPAPPAAPKPNAAGPAPVVTPAAVPLPAAVAPGNAAPVNALPASNASGPGTVPGSNAVPGLNAAPPAPTNNAPMPGRPPSGPPSAALNSSAPRLSFLQGPVKVMPEGSFTLTVQLDGASDLASLAPLQIKFDPTQVHLNDAAPGDLLTHDGAQFTAARDIRNESGEATLTFTRAPGVAGVSGSGPVAKLNFSAVGKGSGAVTIAGAILKDTQSQPVPAELASIPVTVQ